jgi:hypothetical protein
MSAERRSITRELDHRASDGIDVRLLWHAREDRVSITGSNTKTGEAFVVDVAPEDNALHAFHHPVSYVVWRDVVSHHPTEPSTAAHRAA